MFKHWRTLAVMLPLLLAPLVAIGQDDKAGAGEDPVVATVNGVAIHRSEVIRSIALLPQEYQSYPIEVLFPALLNQIINVKLVAEAGRKDSLQDDEDVKRRMADLEDHVIRDVFLERYVESMVSEESVAARYQAFVKELPDEEEIHARHILLESEEDAKAVIGELSGGADFATVAAARSTGPSASRGGDLGYFKRGDMVAEFAEAAFAMASGEVSASPVQTQFGWHVIKVEDRRKVAPPSLEEKRSELVAELQREAIDDLVRRLRETAEIERFNMDGSPVAAPAEGEAPKAE